MTSYAMPSAPGIIQTVPGKVMWRLFVNVSINSPDFHQDNRHDEVLQAWAQKSRS
jgi:hypothetical protein